MRRALLISSSAKPGGAERAFAALVRELPAFGWAPVPVLLEDGPLREWLEPDVTVIDAGRTRQLHRTATAVHALARMIRDEDAEVVVSSQSKCHVYGGAAAALARVPAVWWQHGLPSRSRIETAAAHVPAATIVCVSRAGAAAQRALAPARRIDVVHPGVELDLVRTGGGAALRAALGWGDEPLVGIVGRLEPWKGQELFLRAAALLRQTHPRARFVVAGGAVLGWEGDYPERLHGLASELGLADRVHFVGHQEDVGPWYDALDVVVHASTAEPFGLVLVEAMAAGRPVVTASTAGATEIVEHGVSGLVSEHDAEALAQAVRRILDDARLAGRLVAGGAARASEFSAARAAQRFAAVLDDVAAARRQKAAAL